MTASGLSEIVQVHDAPDDLLAAIDYCYEQGWTDGLPVVPPEVSRVESTLAADGRPPETVLATHPATGLACTVLAAAPWQRFKNGHRTLTIKQAADILTQ